MCLLYGEKSESLVFLFPFGHRLLRRSRNEYRLHPFRFETGVRRRRNADDEERRRFDEKTPGGFVDAANVEIPNSETLGERVPRLEVRFVLHGDEEDAREDARVDAREERFCA